MNKKVWEKPELIVLSRGRPQESVLARCKDSGGGAPGADYVHGGCDVWDGVDFICDWYNCEIASQS